MSQTSGPSAGSAALFVQHGRAVVIRLRMESLRNAVEYRIGVKAVVDEGHAMADLRREILAVEP